MNGLGAALQPQEPNIQPQSMGQGDAAQMTSGQATPEQQALLERFVARAYQLIYADAQTTQAIGQSLDGGGDPKQGLAMATVEILMAVLGAAKKAGQELDAEVILEAGKTIFEDLADMSASAGIMDYSNDPDALEGAFFITLDRARTAMQEAGFLDEQIMAQDAQRLEQMNQSGELEQLIMSQAQADEQATMGAM